MADDSASLVTATKLTESAIESLARNLSIGPEEVSYVIVFRRAKGYLVATPQLKTCDRQRMDVCQFIEHIKEEILQSHNESGWTYLTFAGYLADQAQPEAEALLARETSARRRRGPGCICVYVGDDKYEIC